MTEPRRVKAAALETFVANAFKAVGISADEAASIAELMTFADVNGSDGHGVFRLPQYIRLINISMFREIGEFKASVDQLIRDIRKSRRLPGVDAIRLPGEQSHAKRAERLRLGIPLPPLLVQSLAQLAADLNIAPLG